MTAKAKKTQPSNPYKPTSVYGRVFALASKGLQAGTQKGWAEKSAKGLKAKPQAVMFALAVLGNPNHKSNGGRSTRNDWEVKGKPMWQLEAVKAVK